MHDVRNLSAKLLCYSDYVVASVVSTLVLGDLLQLLIPVTSMGGIWAPMLVFPLAVAAAVVRFPGALGNHWRNGERGELHFLLRSMSRLMFADAGFVLGLFAILKGGWTHQIRVVGGLMLVVSLLFVTIPRVGRVWYLLPPLALGGLCALRYVEIGEQSSLSGEQVRLLAVGAGLLLHAMASAFPLATLETQAMRLSLPYPKWLPWPLVAVLGFGFWPVTDGEFAGVFNLFFWPTLIWLVTRVAVEVLAALPSRLALLYAEVTPQKVGVLAIELTMAALAHLILLLPRATEDHYWTRLMGFSAMVWAVRASAQRAVHLTNLIQTGGLVLSLIGLSLAAELEQYDLPLPVRGTALWVAGVWLACMWASRSRRLIVAASA